jgi:hypothetical protein
MRFRQPYPALQLSSLEEFEASIQLRLPLAYRTFLLQQDGGLLANEENRIRTRAQACPLKEILLNSFLGVQKHFANDRCITDHLEAWADWLPINSIPIALEEFGNLLILDCEEGIVDLFLTKSTDSGTEMGDFPTGYTIAELLALIL